MKPFAGVDLAIHGGDCPVGGPVARFVWRHTRPVIRVDGDRLMAGDDDHPFDVTIRFRRRWHAELWKTVAPTIVLRGQYRREGDDGWRDVYTECRVVWG